MIIMMGDDCGVADAVFDCLRLTPGSIGETLNV